MSLLSRLIFWWYLFLTVLAITASISLSFFEFASGLCLAWIVWFVFFIGSYSPQFSYDKQLVVLKRQVIKLPLGLIAIGSLFASVYATKFYTGKSPLEVLSSFRFGDSLYYDYQEYFRENKLSIFSSLKIIPIFSLLYLKLAELYGFISVIIITEKIKLKNFIFLIIITFSQMLFSVARGTSFEIFEFLLLVFFSISMRNRLLNQKTQINISKIFFGVLVLLGGVLYSLNLSLRAHGAQELVCATSELCLSTNTFLYKCSNALAMFSFQLSGYFLFGIYYTSKFIETFWLKNLSNMSVLFFPFQSLMHTELTANFLCNVELDCRACWVPDIIIYVLKLGFLLLFFVFYWLGVFAKFLIKRVLVSCRFLELGLLYYIFIVLISLPFGNLLTTSSANVLTCIFLIIWFLYKRVMLSFRRALWVDR